MDLFEADDNATPLTAEEKAGLKLKWIMLRSELNEAERAVLSPAAVARIVSCGVAERKAPTER